MNGTKLKVLDLFCGAGGLSWGFEKLGFQIGWALDYWKPATETFKRNHPNTVVYDKDITEVSDDEVRSLFMGAQIVLGGPPCQGFSTAGKRALEDPRNKLVKEFLRVVKILRPMAFVMENVKGFTNFNKGLLHKELLSQFHSLGYNLAAGVLDAVLFGVPQKRKRFFIVGVVGKVPELPVPTHGFARGIFDDDFRYVVTFNDATSDLPLLSKPGEKATTYASLPKNNYQLSMRNGCKEVLTLHEAPKHGKRMINLIKYIPQGKSAFDIMDSIPEELRPTSGFANSYKRIKLNEPAPTITRNFTVPSSANCIHPIANRALTLREGARIQSFPDCYQFVGSFTDKRLLIGNAVPPLLSLAIAHSVAKALEVSTSDEKEKEVLY